MLPDDDLGDEYYDYIHDEVMEELEQMGDDPETMAILKKLWEE